MIMESLCDLLFELSNENRLNLLLELEKEALKLSQISKASELNPQETHRHLSRLFEKKLVGRDLKGLYNLTPYGKLSLKWISNYDFLSKHRDYFINHDVFTLPHELICRLGDLVDCVYTNNVMTTFHHIEMMIKEAEEYVLLMTDQMMMSNYSHLREAIKRKVMVRAIQLREWDSPPDLRERVHEEYLRDLSKVHSSEYFKSKLVDDIKAFLYMSEKEIAALCFPTTNGRFDYLGYHAIDEKSHKWCRDLHSFIWENC
jgi:predicted transcriptional regulator